MTLDDLPDSAKVTLTVGELRELVARSGESRGGPAGDVTPLTVSEVAERIGRSESRVRDYLASGDLEGFRVGREWRIRPQAVDAFFNRCEAAGSEGEQPADDPALGDPEDVDTGGWRDEMVQERSA